MIDNDTILLEGNSTTGLPLREILARVSACVGVLTPEGVLIEVNQGPLQALGFRTEDALGKPAWETPFCARSPQAQAQIKDAVARAARGENIRFDVDVAGEPPMTLDVQFAPSLDEHGRTAYVVATAVDVTGQRRTEEALRQSEARFRAAQDLSLDGFTILRAVRDGTGTIVDFEWTYANEASSRLLKRPVGDLVGHRLLEVLPGNKACVELFARYVRVVETGEPHDVELRYDDDGITGWFRNLAVRLDDGLAVSFCDITERKDIETRLELAKEAGGVATWDWDIVNDVLRVSAAYRRLWGFAPDAPHPTRQACTSRIHPDDRQRATDSVQRGAAGMPYENEFRIVLPDGEVRWLAARGRLERGQDGRPLRMIGADVDITARKRTEEALRESEERLRLAAEVGELAAWEYDVSTGRNRWDTRLAELLGIRQHDPATSGSTWLDVIHPDDRQRVVTELQAAIEARAPYDTEFRVIRSDGAVRWVANKGRLLCDTAGAPVRIVGFTQDITEHKTAEERLRQLADEREALLKEAHHRIKNHVSSVGAMLRLQANAQRSDETRTQLLEASRRINTVGRVHEALYMSDRLGAIDLGTHLQTVMADLAASTVTPSGAQPRIHVGCPAGVRIPSETAAPLSLIAVELVMNAIKHGHVERDTDVDIRLETGAPMRLIISDNGPGISAEDVAKTSGLGLRFVHLFAEKIKGTLSFETLPQGTRATLSFAPP